ncbi:hypothetical protein F5Y13DRAFT_195082 [Hypoxylon sp. FL1857]|nr:hypothetical protein F5Y13DRAFT_195082 [Hypoxylon sp. FL1857]
MEDRVGPLEVLPPEIKNGIITKLSDVRSVFNLALTGPVFYKHIFQDDNGSNERRIAAAIVVAQVGTTLLPIAIARYEASIISWKRVSSPQTSSTPVLASMLCERIIQFSNERLINRHVTELPMRLASLLIANDIISCHEAIQHFSAILSIKAAENMPSHPYGMTDHERESVIPNNREKTRFSKALYIFELISELFMVNKDNTVVWDAQQATVLALATFWQRFAPWENQQVNCTQHLLAEHIRNEIIHGTWHCPSFAPEILWEFVISQGATGLYNIHSKGRHFVPFDVNSVHLCWGRHIILGLPLPVGDDAIWYTSDTLWLKTAGRTVESHQLYNFDIAHLLREFPEEDSGPADIWFHSLVQNIPHPQVAATWLVFKERDDLLRCNRCLTHWGFPFWDRKRLDEYSLGQFPTMEAMGNAMKDGSDNHVSVRALVIHCACRPNVLRICRCYRPQGALS